MRRPINPGSSRMGGKRCADLRAWSNTWSRISRKGRAQRLRAEVDGLCERVAALDEPGADETPRVDAALPEDDLPAAMRKSHTHLYIHTIIHTKADPRGRFRMATYPW